MPSHDTVIDMASTITLLRQIVDQKERDLQEAQERVEYLEKELASVLGEEVQGKHTHAT